MTTATVTVPLLLFELVDIRMHRWGWAIGYGVFILGFGIWNYVAWCKIVKDARALKMKYAGERTTLERQLQEWLKFNGRA